jgi:hypothetical protein
MPLGAASKPTRGVGRMLDLLAGDLSRWGRLAMMGSGEPRLNKRGHALDRALTFLILAVVAAEEMGGVRLAVLGQICGGGFKMLHLWMLCSGYAAMLLYLSS